MFIDEHIREMMVNDPIEFIRLNNDSIVEKVIESFKKRSEAGFKKYGTNLDRKDLSILEWLQHLQEEMQDAILYAEKLKEEHEEELQTEYKLLKVKKVNLKSPFGNMAFDNLNKVSLKYSLDGTEITIEIL